MRLIQTMIIAMTQTVTTVEDVSEEDDGNHIILML